MDVKLDSLIEQIKKEGIEEAKKSSDDILKEAKSKANSIIAEAKKEAAKIVEDGKKQVEKFQKNAESDIQQAARNTELLLKEKIIALFDRVFKKEVANAMTPEFLKDMILNISTSWSKDTSAEIVLSDADQDKLEGLLFKALKSELKETITLKANKDIVSGFQIGMKDNQVYYDFTEDTIAEVLKSLINPRLKEILNSEK
ncbi:V-type ATP synthase subunit E [candidate division KSB1 bacterium]|nr:V-type ATP synthase subunit E [candidate division KSB1 bacterium]